MHHKRRHRLDPKLVAVPNRVLFCLVEGTGIDLRHSGRAGAGLGDYRRKEPAHPLEVVYTIGGVIVKRGNLLPKAILGYRQKTLGGCILFLSIPAGAPSHESCHENANVTQFLLTFTSLAVSYDTTITFFLMQPFPTPISITARHPACAELPYVAAQVMA